MDLVTGAMGSLLFKLGELLKDEYQLQRGSRNKVEFLSTELASMQAALLSIAAAPRGHLNDQVKLWANEVRDLSYNMEDIIDSFFVRVVGGGGDLEHSTSNRFRPFIRKMAKWLLTVKARREIAQALQEVKMQVLEVANRRDRYALDRLTVANTFSVGATTTVDPLLSALYSKVTDLVGLSKPSRELIKELKDCTKKLKIVSIVGFGGLGKTTLARVVYNGLEAQYECTAFVSFSQRPQMKRILKDMLHQLDHKEFATINEASRNEVQLIRQLSNFLMSKRYLIVIDDIWDTESWDNIKHAFPDDGCASRIITTTRENSVAVHINDICYKLPPLSTKKSKSLFYRRLFGPEEKCPELLVEVSAKILNKCGGLPLAIITVASLLATKLENPAQWDHVCTSLGCGLIRDSPGIENMKNIVSLSYYNLPSHLQTCLLYLSIYPEDSEIPKDDLIWKWIAEGFITHETNMVFLFEVGEGYLRQLINSGMVLPCMDYKGAVSRCRLHDIVLEVLCSLAHEENFVTILNHAGSIHLRRNVRRLSLQNRDKGNGTELVASLRQPQVRSITAFPYAINLIPDLQIFDILRVLDLCGCHLGEGSHLNLHGVGNLFHLRYLCLADTHICELPAKLGRLQFLQVLDVRYNPRLTELPLAVYELKRLMCLRVDGYCTRLPDGLGNLTSIQVLTKIRATLSIVKDLCNLTMLRELKIKFEDNASMELRKTFVQSLSHLKNLQSLVIRGSFPSMNLLGEYWVPPQQLREFESAVCGIFSAVPAWIKVNPLILSVLSDLTMGFEELLVEDMLILGMLPALRRLWLFSSQQTQGVLPIGTEGYRCLTTISLYCKSPKRIAFQRGALPKVEVLLFNFSVRMASADGNGSFNFGLMNLASLQHTTVGIDRDGSTIEDVNEAAAALRREISTFKNRPSIIVDIRPPIKPCELEKSDITVDELIGETRKLSGKFQRFRAQACSGSNSAI
ncbi:Disease resistance protein RPP13 [Hordeum vulgare]|nr:Disease resistance protein RPP13 [Hordeum vulgare]